MYDAKHSTIDRVLAFMSLFGSASTLICCALPALLVTLGLGAVMAGLVGTFPQLVWFSEHKALIFVAAGFLLSVNSVVQYYSRRLPCPVDPVLARACMKTRSWSSRLFVVALVIYCIGAIFAFGGKYLA